jgi:hypothetical protein
MERRRRHRRRGPPNRVPGRSDQVPTLWPRRVSAPMPPRTRQPVPAISPQSASGAAHAVGRIPRRQADDSDRRRGPRRGRPAAALPASKRSPEGPSNDVLQFARTDPPPRVPLPAGPPPPGGSGRFRQAQGRQGFSTGRRPPPPPPPMLYGGRPAWNWSTSASVSCWSRAEAVVELHLAPAPPRCPAASGGTRNGGCSSPPPRATPSADRQQQARPAPDPGQKKAARITASGERPVRARRSKAPRRSR